MRAVAFAAVALAATVVRGQAGPVAAPVPVGVTQPVPVQQVEDAAVWVHPTDPAASLLLVASKTRGLEIHRTDGLLLKNVADGTELAGLDVLCGVSTGVGPPVDLALAACPAGDATGVRAWQMNPDRPEKPADVDGGRPLPVLDGGVPLGLWADRDPRTGTGYVYVSGDHGKVEQYALTLAGGKLEAKRVRAFARPGKVKAGVVDSDRRVCYFAEEKVGVWRCPADPADPAEPTLVVKVNDHGLAPDFAGLALYDGGGGAGYLLVVSQGPRGTPSHVGLFDRADPSRFVGDVRPAAGGGHVPSGSSGIVVTSRPTGPWLPRGFVALKDRGNPNGVEDYKIYAWPGVAPVGR